MRIVLLVGVSAVLLGACSAAQPDPIASPRGLCYALTLRTTAEAADRFEHFPAVLEITDERLAPLREPDAARPEPVYFRTRSWPSGWRAGDAADPRQPWLRAWHSAQWQYAPTTGRTKDPEVGGDSLRIDVGPYASAFEGYTVTARRTGASLAGRVVWFTDALGPHTPRSARLDGRRVACPSTRAYPDTRPVRG